MLAQFLVCYQKQKQDRKMGALPPAAKDWGSGGFVPQPPEEGESGSGASRAQKFCIFLQK